MEATRDGDMMQFVDTGYDSDDEPNHDVDLSEDGGSSVASADVPDVIDMSGLNQPFEFGWMDSNFGYPLDPLENAFQMPETAFPSLQAPQNAEESLGNAPQAIPPMHTPRSQGLLQLLQFGAPKSEQPLLVPPHSDILDVADQIHNNQLPLSLRLDSFPQRSRVETQIKCRLFIQNKSTGQAPGYSLLHLPSDTIARPRFQLANAELLADPQFDNATLYLSVDAVNPDDLSEQILMCSKCLERERRRAFRKKAMDPHEESYWSGATSRRIIVFNCRQIMPISASGQVELPLRVACYCRHHAAKTGYQLLLGVRDRFGNLLGRTVSPKLFITDSHKDSRRAEHKEQPELDASDHTDASFTPSSADSAIESESDFEERRRSIHRAGSNASAAGRSHPYARPRSARSVPYWLAGVDQSSTVGSMSKTSSVTSMNSMVMNSMGAGPKTAAGFTATPASMPASMPGSMPTSLTSPMTSPVAPNQGWQISRVIPPSGSMRGGIEITLLGEGFRPGLVAMFGELQSISTQFWSSSTIIAHLPPSSQPGPVPVTFKDSHPVSNAPVFTYINDGEDKLKELTLQMIGYKMGADMDSIAQVVEKMAAGSDGFDSTSSGSLGVARGATAGSSTDHDVGAGAVRAPLSAEKMALWALENLPKIATPFPVNVNLRNDEGQSMVHLAAMLGLPVLLKTLMAKGAYIDLQDVSGYTPLHFAVLFDNRNVARMLLEADADPFNHTSHGLTARDLADGTVVDLLPRDQRSWYSELNRRRSSSSLSELDETPYRPPPYSQLFPEAGSPETKDSRVRSSTVRQVIDIEVEDADDEAEDEAEVADKDARADEADDEVEDEDEDEDYEEETAETNDDADVEAEDEAADDDDDDDDDEADDETAAKRQPGWVDRWANRDLDIRNDKMLFTFWIPLALTTMFGILAIYTLQNYGTPGAPFYVTKFGDAVAYVFSHAVDRVMPIPRTAHQTR